MINEISDRNNGRTFMTAADLAAAIPRSRRSGGGFVAPCPCHRDRRPSLSIRDGETSVLLKCFSKGCSYGEIMAAIGGRIIAPDQTVQHVPRSDASEKARAIWSESAEVCEGDPVWIYLTQARRLKLEAIPSSLRTHRNLPYWECINQDGQENWVQVGSYPAMVAAFVSVAGDVVAIHRTYLTSDGCKAFAKDSGRDCRKALGSINGASIRLFPVAERLGIAEGIETAIAATLLSGVPTWAAYSASNLQNVVIPDSVRELIIFADHDRSGVGEQAAQKLARRLVGEGRKAKVVLPSQPGDWADVISEESK